MAITKLMHMKQAVGTPHAHLQNAINYILDVKNGGKKTDYGTLVGGNSGLDADEILHNFLETKDIFEKREGRQGYHFVVSFDQGETDTVTAYQIVQEFCEEYLGDNYDYVFAVHNDKKHLHGHIIFNSVSRIDGYKYRYNNGDWEKYIQPVTDRICIKHNLSPLQFDEKRVGVSYASWASKQKGQFNWSNIIRADVDFAIQQAASYEEFKDILSKMNYEMHEGYSKKYNSRYITFKFISPDGKEHRRRSYNLAKEGYSPKEIQNRILSKGGSRSFEQVMERISKGAEPYLRSAMLRSTQTYKRLYQAVSYYKLPNPYAVPSGQVRKDMLRIDNLLAECRYLKEHVITNVEQLKQRDVSVKIQIDKVKCERKVQYQLQDTNREYKEWMERYEQLQREYKKVLQEGRDSFEEIEDEILQLEKMYPKELLENKSRIEAYSKELAELRKEKRILERILRAELEKDQKVQPKMQEVAKKK